MKREIKTVVKDYGSDIDWNVGSLFAHDDILLEIDRVTKSIGDFSNIKYVFGGIPCIMHGGRIPPQNVDIQTASSIIDKYNRNDIGCRLTFSSPFITRGDLADPTSNAFLNKLEINNKNHPENKNGVIVESDLLAEYIKYMYPSLELISSQVKPSVEVGLGSDTAEYYNDLLDKFDIVVVNPAKIHDKNFLDAIKDKDRVEFIANHRCLPNCPMAGKHYEFNTKLSQLIVNGKDQTEAREQLGRVHEYCQTMRKNNPCLGTSMSNDDIKELAKNGFHHFKIEGRENHPVTFIRDLGDYIFNHEVFERVMHSIVNTSV